MAEKSNPIEGYRKHNTRDAGGGREQARSAIAMRDKAEAGQAQPAPKGTRTRG